MNAAQFIVAFPEFFDTQSPLIQAKLNLAAARMGGPDVNTWGAFTSSPAPNAPLTQADYAQGYLAADLLHRSPFGTATAMVSLSGKGADNGSSIYREMFEEIELAMCQGPITAGGFVTNAGGIALPAQLLTGAGTVAVVNGSPSITFSTPQTLSAGTLIVFMVQPGVYYALLSNVVASTAGTLSAAYGGVTNAATNWTY
jgi:hypothetical protein